MKTRVAQIISVFLLLLALCGCSKSNPLIGKWISDADNSTVIEFLDEERLTVTTGDTVLDGVYYLEENNIKIILNSPYASYTVNAQYQITEENKLVLINEDGKKEQFTQK